MKYFVFIVSFFLLLQMFSFCNELISFAVCLFFCGEFFLVSASFLLVPLQLWATVLVTVVHESLTTVHLILRRQSTQTPKHIVVPGFSSNWDFMLTALKFLFQVSYTLRLTCSYSPTQSNSRLLVSVVWHRRLFSA